VQRRSCTISGASERRSFKSRRRQQFFICSTSYLHTSSFVLFHALLHLNQHLIVGVKADETLPRVLDVEDDENREDSDPSKGENVQPTALLTGRHTEPGKHRTNERQQPSPLGPLVAYARKESYSPKQGTSAPFHGYYFKILTRQGTSAPGGAYNYIINGNMIAGFALIAYPATWGNSGVMTFVINQEGRAYQKDLGPRTAEIAGALTEYNPDSTWTLANNDE
jgi:hypothetical protein